MLGIARPGPRTNPGQGPGWGILIHGQGCEVRRVKLEPAASRPGWTLKKSRRCRERGHHQDSTPIPHCQVCEFRQKCHAEATAKDNLSLLRGMGEKEIRKYGKRGIFTVTQFSCTFRPGKRSKRQGQKSSPISILCRPSPSGTRKSMSSARRNCPPAPCGFCST